MKLFSIILINVYFSISHSFRISKLFTPKNDKVLNPPEIKDESCMISPHDHFQMSWYVVAEAANIKKNQPYKIIVWNKPYVIWKTETGEFTALEDTCPHRGASLSAGKITVNRVICPYHGYEFNHQGNLTIVPGQCFQHSSSHTCARFPIVERHGWIYLNTNQIPSFATQSHIDILSSDIFIEPEATDKTMSLVHINTHFNTFARIVSENSLDIMHIAFVHTFGNQDKPAPSYDDPPKQISQGHWKTSYVYESGKQSMVHKIFNVKKIDIDNEFSLPHTTIARIKFGEGFVNTIVTAACPINETSTQLFVKTYRNFFHGFLGDILFEKMMMNTLNEDKSIIETITIENMEGKFNMKFDKLQNTYRTFYKHYIRNSSRV